MTPSRYPRNQRQTSVMNGYFNPASDMPMAEGNLLLPGNQDWFTGGDVIENEYQTKQDFRFRPPEINLDEISNMLDSLAFNDCTTLDSFAAFSDDPMYGPPASLATPVYVSPTPSQNAVVDAIQGFIKAGTPIAAQYATQRLGPQAGRVIQAAYPGAPAPVTRSTIPTAVWVVGGIGALALIFFALK